MIVLNNTAFDRARVLRIEFREGEPPGCIVVLENGHDRFLLHVKGTLAEVIALIEGQERHDPAGLGH